MADITFNGMTMEFDVVVGMMDSDIRESVLSVLGDCSEQDMLDAYMQAHKAKHGNDFLQF